jgi:hypothetical protein
LSPTTGRVRIDAIDQPARKSSRERNRTGYRPAIGPVGRKTGPSSKMAQASRVDEDPLNTRRSPAPLSGRPCIASPDADAKGRPLPQRLDQPTISPGVKKKSISI